MTTDGRQTCKCFTNKQIIHETNLTWKTANGTTFTLLEWKRESEQRAQSEGREDVEFGKEQSDWSRYKVRHTTNSDPHAVKLWSARCDCVNVRLVSIKHPPDDICRTSATRPVQIRMLSKKRPRHVHSIKCLDACSGWFFDNTRTWICLVADVWKSQLADLFHTCGGC